MRTGGIFYFPWHRHRIEGTNGFYCIIRKTLASGVNGIAKVPKRKVFTEVGLEPSNVRSPVDALTHSAIAPHRRRYCSHYTKSLPVQARMSCTTGHNGPQQHYPIQEQYGDRTDSNNYSLQRHLPTQHCQHSICSCYTHHHSCPSTSRMSKSNRALTMPGTADGDAISRCQVLGRAGSVYYYGEVWVRRWRRPHRRGRRVSHGTGHVAGCWLHRGWRIGNLN